MQKYLTAGLIFIIAIIMILSGYGGNNDLDLKTRSDEMKGFEGPVIIGFPLNNISSLVFF